MADGIGNQKGQRQVTPDIERRRKETLDKLQKNRQNMAPASPPLVDTNSRPRISVSGGTAPLDTGGQLPERFGESGFYRTYLDVVKSIESTFINNTPVMSVGTMNFNVAKLMAAAVLSKTNAYLVGARGSGKTLLAETIYRSILNEDGMYLRGDLNMTVKDLFRAVNLDAKTDEERVMVSKRIRHLMALIDELNRVPGPLQNQFLNLMDGYFEINGKKYYIGNQNYFLAIATGNPPTNGDYGGTFDEDLALLNRIYLLINTDTVKLADGDAAEIARRAIDKSRIPLGDLRRKVLSSYRRIEENVMGNSETAEAYALLAEMTFKAFRTVKIGPRGAEKEVDKAVEENWREILLTQRQGGGQHSGAELISYCSDIPMRTITGTGRFAFTLFDIASLSAKVDNKTGKKTPIPGNSEHIATFFEVLKLALNYDRRFISPELPEQLGKSRGEMLSKAFNDLSSRIDPDLFENGIIALQTFDEALANGNERDINQIVQAHENVKGQSPIFSAVLGILKDRIRRRNEKLDYERQTGGLNDDLSDI